MKPYPKYQESGIDWLGKIPSHWEMEKLKYLAKVNNSNVDKKIIDGELPVRLCNYTDVYYNSYIHPGLSLMNATATEEELNKFRLHEGDVLITKDSESWDDIAIPAYVIESSDDVVCGYHLSHIHPNTEKLIGKYLFFSFMSDDIRVQFETSATGITRYGVPKYSIDNGLFVIPPLPEQKQIAKYLDHKTAKIDTLIEKKKRLIELLKEERTAVINQAVTKGLDPNVPMKDLGIEWLGEIPEHWEVKRLKFMAEVVLGKMLTSNDKGGYHLKPYLRAKNLTWLKVNSEDIKEMWFSDNEIKQYRLRKNDLLVSEGGEVGRTCIWNEEIPECYIQNSVNRVRFLEALVPRYYLYLFLIYGYKGHFDAVVSRVSIAHLTKEKLVEISFIVPPYVEQKAIVEMIDQEVSRIDCIMSKSEKEIELLQEYRTALISEVVTGKIDVREETI